MPARVRGPRLDLALVHRGLAGSVPEAQRIIGAGEVLVDEVPCDKPAKLIGDQQAVRLRVMPARFVSRGGVKLQAALDAWRIDPTGRICADLGASTGGFTDCLLQAGAARVYAIDVGYGQLAWRLRQDPRVVVLERTNARLLRDLPTPISLLVGDLSFISLTVLLPTVARLLALDGEAALLVKPQFEVASSEIAPGGLVRDEGARQRALEAVKEAARAAGFPVRGAMESPLPGARAGNREWLLWLGPRVVS